MAYSGSPATSAIDRVRLMCGDIDTSLVFLDDATYSYYLTKNNNNEKRTAREIMPIILFSLAKMRRERAYMCEVYGADTFNNYMQAIKLALANPAIYDVEFTPYAGGISRSDMQANSDDNDTLSPKVYRGVTTDSGTPDYYNKEVWVASDDSTGF